MFCLAMAISYQLSLGKKCRQESPRSRLDRAGQGWSKPVKPFLNLDDLDHELPSPLSSPGFIPGPAKAVWIGLDSRTKTTGFQPPIRHFERFARFRGKSSQVPLHEAFTHKIGIFQSCPIVSNRVIFVNNLARQPATCRAKAKRRRVGDFLELGGAGL
jgi:hypothetical protein